MGKSLMKTISIPREAFCDVDLRKLLGLKGIKD
jgi:hypothetical protein